VSGQERYLLDTNIISETWKPRANQGVIAFLQSAEPSSVFVSVLTIGELRKGVTAKRLKDPVPNAAARLAAWVEGLELSFADRILAGYSEPSRCARDSGEIAGSLDGLGAVSDHSRSPTQILELR
jgi:predicted nucleic acid-binding protein